MRKKILLYFHADIDSIQAQDRDVRIWAKYLNEDLFHLEIFCRNKPHPDLLKSNITIHQLPRNRMLRYIYRIFVTFIKKRDILLFGYATELELNLIKWYRHITFGKRAKIIYYLVNRFPYSNKAISNQIIKLSDSQFAISKTIQADVLKAYKLNIPIVHLSYDKPQSPSQEQINERKKVLSVGSLQFRKQPVLFFDLAYKLPEFDFYWIGTGELDNIIQERIAKAPLPNLYFLGSQPNETVLNFMTKCDLFVFPSIAEGFPNVIIEALSSCLPVIAYEDYGPEAVINGYNGFIVNNLFDMANKINFILNNDEILSNLKLNAFESAKEYFAENNVHELTNYLFSILNED